MSLSSKVENNGRVGPTHWSGSRLKRRDSAGSWARSSVVEPSSYTRLVVGSIPTAPTMIRKDSWELSARSIIVWKGRDRKTEAAWLQSPGRGIFQQKNIRDRSLPRPHIETLLVFCS